jgi:glucose-6-phosphate dehydrogenase assembly protein OpcA
MATPVAGDSKSGLTDLKNVESELARLRGRDGHGASVRATTVNLVVFSPSDDCTRRAADAMTRIGGGRPLRSLVLEPGRGSARAHISSSCWLAATGQEVCSEQVIVEAEPAALPSTVVGLLVPDLPVFLLWQGEIGSGDRRALLEELAEVADRLIVDSDECGVEAAQSVLELTPSLTDLAWTRLAPWREALAALGDSPGGLKAYGRAHSIEAHGPENEAQLLAGWLRSRLGRQIGLDHARRRRELARVCVDCGQRALVVERTGKGSVGRAVGADGLEHPVVLPSRTWAWLVGAELDRLGSDRAFEDALAAAL